MYKYINNFNTSLENRKLNITKKYNDYLNLKKKYKNIKIRVLPKDFLNEENQKLLPLSTFSNKKIFNCNENGYYPLWDSDRFGFNNPDYLWNKNEVEYLIIGDSYAMGQCVYEKNSISGNLRALFPNNAVINLAIAGNGPLLEFATLKEYTHIVNPNKILWFFSEVNDLSDLLKESKNKILMDYFLKDNFSQNLVMRQNEINDKLNEKLSKSLSEIKNEKTFHLKFDIPRFIKLYTLRELTINTIFKKEDSLDPKFKEIMLKAKIFAEKNNAEFYFIYLPQFSRYSSYYSYPNVKNSKKIIKIINDLNIKLINIHDELFAKQPDPLIFFPFRSTGHYNENGYKQIAIIIHDKIN